MNAMIQKNDELTGDFSFDERKYIDYIIATGLKECKNLLAKNNRPQTQGAIFGFIKIQTINSYEEFYNAWDRVHKEVEASRYKKDNIDEYWQLRGEELQFEFVMTRLITLRIVLTDLTVKSYSCHSMMHTIKYLQKTQGLQ